MICQRVNSSVQVNKLCAAGEWLTRTVQSVRTICLQYGYFFFFFESHFFCYWSQIDKETHIFGWSSENKSLSKYKRTNTYLFVRRIYFFSIDVCSTLLILAIRWNDYRIEWKNSIRWMFVIYWKETTFSINNSLNIKLQFLLFSYVCFRIRILFVKFWGQHGNWSLILIEREYRLRCNAK